MPLVAAKCTQCGADLEVDSSKDAAICPCCNTPFITEKAINNYNTYQSYTIANANIQLNDENSIEKRLENAEIFLSKFNDRQKALELFQSVTNDAPGNYKGWWGVVRIRTREFTRINVGKNEFKEISVFANRAIKVCPKENFENVKTIWDDYSQKVVAQLNEVTGVQNIRAGNINDIDSQIASLNNQISSLQKEISKRKYKSYKKLFVPSLLASIILPFVLASQQSAVLIVIFTILTLISISLFVFSIVLFFKNKSRLKSCEKKTISLNSELEAVTMRRNELYNLYCTTENKIS